MNGQTSGSKAVLACSESVALEMFRGRLPGRGGFIMEMDLRRHPRIKASIPVHFVCSSELQDAVSADISQGGVYVATDTPIQMGNLVTLQFDIPTVPGAVKVDGSVAHHHFHPNGKPAGFGVEFIAFRSEGKVRLWNHIAEMGGLRT